MEQLEDDYPSDADWQVLVRLYEEDYLDDNARTLAKAMEGIERLNKRNDCAAARRLRRINIPHV
ncbi:hypothetical protein HCU66_26785 [Pseudomonas frederiksbergensis]|uniref:hypothetical protein n=1 Tax=Pseudomonas frederiksbergensis TaxID=104087 RepID=UPI0019824181|nr:hypothetical protein [Pseudomonas frederiksbergensis]MBN3865795.1 hypothetical protein [Pseudomonas frederiksbergensis]